MVRWVQLVAIFYLLPALAFGQSNDDEDTKLISKEIDPVDYEDNEAFGQSNEDEDTKLINNEKDPVDYESNEDEDTKLINIEKDSVDYEDIVQFNEDENTKLTYKEKYPNDYEHNKEYPPPSRQTGRRAQRGGDSTEYVYPESYEEYQTVLERNVKQLVENV